LLIRETKKSNKGYKKQFIYHLLVESYRTDKGPRQSVLAYHVVNSIQTPCFTWTAFICNGIRFVNYYPYNKEWQRKWLRVRARESG